MVKGLYTAYTGMINEQNRMDIMTNNLANASTVGYKKEGSTSQSFDDVLTVKIKDQSVGMRNVQRLGVKNPGVKIGENYTDYSQGSFRITGNTYDLALSGEGFFAIEFTNKAGETDTKYTRAGQFTLNKDGYLVTEEGDYVLDTQNRRIRLNTLLDSKITDDVKTMVFECATFDGTNIRLSAKKVGLRTDASGKYEKGLDPNTAEEAVNRACQLIEELGAGEVVGGMIDVYPVKAEESRVKFQPEKINALLGTDIAPETMLQYMEKIELRYDKETGEIVAPTWRQDIHCMADLAEEVARFYGYDKIGTTLPTGEATTGKLSYKLRVEQIARNVAEFCGFSEGMTYSFESPKVFDKLNIPAEDAARQTVVISNPLGEDFSVMRTLPLHGMLNSLSTNYNRRNKNVRLYELANVYLPKSLPLTELPDERMQFTLGMYGDGDFFTMKGVVEEFFDKAGMHGRVSYDPEAGKAFLHPGRQAAILYEGDMVGYLGEVHPDVLDNYKIGEKAYVAVLDMPAVTPHTSFDRKYTGIAKYPAVSRDLSMVVPKNILVGQIEEMIVQRGGKILESYNLFDIYEGSQILEGYKSVAYSITFRAKDHTLEEREINGAMNKILNGLKSMGIELRA